MSLSSTLTDRASLFEDVLAGLGDAVSTPAPIVLLDVVADNIARMQAFAHEHGKQLFPHVKTHKSVHIGKMQLESGGKRADCRQSERGRDLRCRWLRGHLPRLSAVGRRDESDPLEAIGAEHAAERGRREHRCDRPPGGSSR